MDSMKPAAFVPGFRFSVVDGFVLVGGVVGTIVLSIFAWWQGFVLGFVIAHFFLFCNVVRMARPLELLWGGVFVALAGSTIATGTPGWLVTTVVSLSVTVIAVIVQIRNPEYHGVGWKWINPGLPAWWEARIARQAGGQPVAPADGL
jgi:hypothetical protein